MEMVHLMEKKDNAKTPRFFDPGVVQVSCLRFRTQEYDTFLRRCYLRLVFGFFEFLYISSEKKAEYF